MLESMTLDVAWVLFALCAGVIGVAGVRLAGLVDRIADRTGLGEAVAGAVLMGLTTSLSGSVLSVSAAVSGDAELAMSNAVGGIAAQTLFLAVADIAYRRANLEHAAASIGNMIQGSLLMAQMSWLLVAFAMPQWTVGHVHVVTPLLLASYVYGLRLVRQTQAQPMWTPARTHETRVDEPEEANQRESLDRSSPSSCSRPPSGPPATCWRGALRSSSPRRCSRPLWSAPCSPRWSPRCPSWSPPSRPCATAR